MNGKLPQKYKKLFLVTLVAVIVMWFKIPPAPGPAFCVCLFYLSAFVSGSLVAV